MSSIIKEAYTTGTIVDKFGVKANPYKDEVVINLRTSWEYDFAIGGSYLERVWGSDFEYSLIEDLKKRGYSMREEIFKKETKIFTEYEEFKMIIERNGREVCKIGNFKREHLLLRGFVTVLEEARKSLIVSIRDREEFYSIFDSLLKEDSSVIGRRYREYLKRPEPKNFPESVPITREEEKVEEIIISITG